MADYQHILIKKSDLKRHSEILGAPWKWKEEDKDVLTFLARLLEGACFEIDGIELLFCQPEFAHFNQGIRAQLDEWGVQYSSTII